MKHSKEVLQEAVSKSFTIADVCKNLGIAVHGSSHQHISSKVKEYGIDTSHFNKSWVKIAAMASRTKKHFSERFVNNQNTTKRVCGRVLRAAMLEAGVEYKCVLCDNNGRWLDNDLGLEIDHIDGNWKNNLQENLRFLCPNCHSQTHNFGVRNKVKTKAEKSIAMSRALRKNQRPSYETLAELLKTKTLVEIGRMYGGVKGFTVRRWIRFYEKVENKT